MSADNWTICPHCVATASQERKAVRDRAAAVYGQVAPEEYRKLLADAEAPLCVEETLREDFSIGMDADGEFSVQYAAHCNRCGFSFRFDESRQAATT